MLIGISPYSLQSRRDDPSQSTEGRRPLPGYKSKRANLSGKERPERMSVLNR